VTASKCRIYCFNSYSILFDEEDFSAGHFLMRFNATVMDNYFSAQLRSWMDFGKLWQWQRHKRPMQNLAWRTAASLRLLILMPGPFYKIRQGQRCIWWQWRQWSSVQKGLDTWTKSSGLHRQWRRVKKKNTKKCESFVRWNLGGRHAPLYNNAAMPTLGQGYWDCRRVGGTHTRDNGGKDNNCRSKPAASFSPFFVTRVVGLNIAK